MSADRTLMSQVRTALSMIGFGFTIYQVFSQLAANDVLVRGNITARWVGVSLLVLGVLLLVMGLIGHSRFSRQLTARRAFLSSNHLLHHEVKYSASPTFVTAALLLATGLAALVAIAFQIF